VRLLTATTRLRWRIQRKLHWHS